MFRRLELLLGIVAIGLAAQACSSSASPSASAPPKTPTPGLYSRLNPDIVEETPTSFIQRYKKDSVMKVDDKHIRNPIVGPKLEIYKEDAEYYYVYVSKPMTKEERDARQQAAAVGKSVEEQAAASDQSGTVKPTGPPDSELQDLTPKRVKGRLKLDLLPHSGLPSSGQWRANFAVADMNGDGIPDIVSGPFRGGDTTLHVWLGDGTGHFTPWHMTFFDEKGKTAGTAGLVYGGVAVGDIDGDGKMDVVAAGHVGGLVSFFGDGKGNFRVVHSGLPRKDFSSQAVALVDADGDGKLDIVAAKDGGEETPGLDRAQIRVYLYRGAKGWELKNEGIVGGFSSNSVQAWDFDHDGKVDILTGSIQHGALTLLWKNNGDGTFAPTIFEPFDGYSYHLVTAPGTFGKNRDAAFADLYRKGQGGAKPAVASGISVDSYHAGTWSLHRVWIKRNSNAAIFAVAMGDLDGDGLDDVVFPDTEEHKIRVFFQQPDGSFVEADASEEPALPSTASCVRVVDLNGDGKLDIVVEMTTASSRPDERGGWAVYLNRGK